MVYCITSRRSCIICGSLRSTLVTHDFQIVTTSSTLTDMRLRDFDTLFRSLMHSSRFWNQVSRRNRRSRRYRRRQVGWSWICFTLKPCIKSLRCCFSCSNARPADGAMLLFRFPQCKSHRQCHLLVLPHISGITCTSCHCVIPALFRPSNDWEYPANLGSRSIGSVEV